MMEIEPPPPPEVSPPQPEVVELATLALPATALDGGMEAGQSAHVVLEASNETVEHIQTATQDATADQPMISAVVDLETLAELAGATEEDFISGLHQDARDNRAAETAAEVEGDEEVGETTPLVVVTTTTTDEEEATGTEQITLPADPFIESLADALLQTVPEEEDLQSIAGTTVGGHESLAGATWASASLVVTGDAATLLSGEQLEEQHFAHDAFLLDVPTTDEDGHTEHRYVLALPEIVVEPSVQTDTSQLSHGSFTMMERAMSILPSTTRLPSDIEAVHLEATEVEPSKEDPTTQVHLDLVVERRVPVIGYVILFAGLFALASVGAALDLQEGGVTPTMKTLWRQTATFLVYLPMVIKSLRQDGIPKLESTQWVLLPISSMAYTYMTLAFVLALEMTSLANAFVLSNMTSLVIIAGRAVLGLPILALEGGGAITGFIGAAICAQAQGADIGRRLLLELDVSFWGNAIAFSASFGTAAYLLIAKKLRPKMDLFVFMSIIMGFGALLLVPYLYLIGEDITFDMHPVHGVFGWLNLQADRLPLELYMAVVCNCLGTTGYIAVMKYFDPIVPATVMLLEPVIGALLGAAAGTAPIPGLQTWLGNLVVAGGTFLVTYAGSSKTESIDATEALRPGVGTFVDGDDSASLKSSVVKSPLIPRPSALPSVDERKPQTDAVGDNNMPAPAKVVWTTE
ncbi:Drug Metabolite Transporter (DMT) Superfamily [Seminavis robusta]|uniref:Drug Metabolite Transporter (DMT) Superfamily n=1 Tax=Seminavis robusta TaxID=568900 RepID=A0A9N8EFQ5_9STRA|nr:Drug Metabolite Transporter (DMT) Superfamily [Seminavis robusta]|eukprot:Sro932_g221690.1 Drug Metabolite Transporter (DMT) Superfamily (691) ;mRNA; f:33691-35867